MEQPNGPSTLRIGLAAARNAPTVDERLETADRFLAEATQRDVAIVCFPETYIPGLRGMEWETERGLHNVAFVIARDGEVIGYRAGNGHGTGSIRTISSGPKPLSQSDPSP